MTPLIARGSSRFDPIYGDTRYRVPPRTRRAARGAAAIARDEAVTTGDLHSFLTAFAGGFVFFSVFFL